MIPHIFSLYGPFNINSYGFCIALGLLLFRRLCSRDKRMHQVMQQPLFDSLFIQGLIIGIIGGRVLYYIESPHSFSTLYQLFFIWQPGFSILGTLISVALFTPLFLFFKKIPLLPMLDIIATYGALVQSIARIGCFLAGCCHGIESSLPWALTYTNPQCYAPCGIALHPVQLYSSLTLLGIFLFIYYVIRPRAQNPGIIVCTYLLLVSFERFVFDFIRADRVVVHGYLSIDQLLACALFFTSMGLLFSLLWFYKAKKYEFV